jgi:hypothetical protein
MASGRGNNFLRGLKNKSIYHLTYKNLSRIYVLFVILSWGIDCLKTEKDR